MAVGKRDKAVCDICGFVYPHNVMKKNSFGLLVCPTDFDGAFDEKNHPQNRVADVRDDPTIKDPRPDDGGRGLTWQQATTKWEDTDNWWNTI